MLRLILSKYNNSKEFAYFTVFLSALISVWGLCVFTEVLVTDKSFVQFMSVLLTYLLFFGGHILWVFSITDRK